ENKKNLEAMYSENFAKYNQSEEIKAQNNGMQQAFGVQGFPTVYFATAKIKEGKPSFTGLGNTGYVAGGPAAWLAVANGILKTK
ncbi:MAG: hypothetical protein K2X95_11660, partial [Flavobacteriaceae bacterium]|nr:hypothetical protein [Flavobacteriaceae bacterium]